MIPHTLRGSIAVYSVCVIDTVKYDPKTTNCTLLTRATDENFRMSAWYSAVPHNIAMRKNRDPRNACRICSCCAWVSTMPKYYKTPDTFVLFEQSSLKYLYTLVMIYLSTNYPAKHAQTPPWQEPRSLQLFGHEAWIVNTCNNNNKKVALDICIPLQEKNFSYPQITDVRQKSRGWDWSWNHSHYES